VVVLLHEAGHAAATVAVGGHVAGFHYGLFEGSVTATGAITPAQAWLIALAGNLVSAVVGLAMVAAGAGATRLRRPLRYVLLFGGLFEVVFALVGYPLLSESVRFGDWLVIYDFSSTPTLSWATAVVHAALLVALWRWWRGSLHQRLFALTHGEEARLAELRSAVHRAPGDVDARLALANLFAGRGDLGLAAAALDDAAPHSDDPARLHLARARLALYRGRWNQALVATQAGLAAGPGADGLRQRLWANQGLALAQMERPALALSAFDHLDPATLADPRVRYCRGVSRLGAGDEEDGREDLRAVVDALADGEPLRRWAEARLSGRTLDDAGDSDRPAWQRRRQSPPAPIAGV
jgi:hypothetical protein